MTQYRIKQVAPERFDVQERRFLGWGRMSRTTKDGYIVPIQADSLVKAQHELRAELARRAKPFRPVIYHLDQNTFFVSSFTRDGVTFAYDEAKVRSA